VTKFKKIKNVLIITLIVFALLLIIELVFYLNYKRYHAAQPFLFNTNAFNQDYSKTDYCEIDPLTGWKVPDQKLMEHGYLVKNNMILLKTSSDTCHKVYRILITGGSTSDVYYNNRTWPVYLQKLLNSNGYCTDIYVGAVAGYNSGQEVLKLIKDGLSINPDIHISYSGANECPDNSSYITTYEQSAFESLNHHKSFFMPNTYQFITSLFPGNKSVVKILKREIRDSTFVFYKKNIEIMNAIAVNNKYSFIEILQPIDMESRLSKFKDDQKKEKEKKYLSAHRVFYPKAIRYAKEKPYVYDLSGIFDHADKNDVFIDYCHVKPDYQNIIAEKVFELLLENGYIKKSNSKHDRR
jgi:hypothetical protein